MVAELDVRVVVDSVIPLLSGETTAEPYLWPVFFAVDGPSVNITDPPDFLLRGTATVLQTNGDHGNLGSVRGHGVVPVPESLGLFVHHSLAMPLPLPCDPIRPDGILGLVGLVIVLLEEDNVTDAAARAGYQRLVSVVQSALNELIDGRSVFAGDPTREEMNAFKVDAKREIRDAVKSEMDFLERIWAFVNPDEFIGFDVVLFGLADLIEEGPQRFNSTFTHSVKVPRSFVDIPEDRLRIVTDIWEVQGYVSEDFRFSSRWSR